MTATKPLLLIDVDGPLNAFGGPYSGGEAPDGYRMHRLKDRSFTDDKGRAWVQGGLRIWLNPAHGPMLLALADRCELAWCTAWRETANEFIGPLIGLPELPVVSLPDGWVTLDDHIWKLPGDAPRVAYEFGFERMDPPDSGPMLIGRPEADVRAVMTDTAARFPECEYALRRRIVGPWVTLEVPRTAR